MSEITSKDLETTRRVLEQLEENSDGMIEALYSDAERYVKIEQKYFDE